MIEGRPHRGRVFYYAEFVTGDRTEHAVGGQAGEQGIELADAQVREGFLGDAVLAAEVRTDRPPVPLDRGLAAARRADRFSGAFPSSAACTRS